MTLESPHQVVCESGSVYEFVAFAPEVLGEIRRRATAQFLALPRGGLETGGVLYGVRSGRGIVVLAQRELEIEYLTGPSFALSENDEAQLRTLLAGDTPAGPDGDAVEVIGWWHSHTRSDVSLTESDMDVHRRFFGAAGSLAVVIRPFKFEPSDVAVYTPADTGQTACCRLSLPNSRPTSAAPDSAPVVATPASTALIEAPVRPARAVPLELEPRMPAFLSTPQPRGTGRKAAMAGTAAALLCAAVAGVLWMRPARTPERMRLEVTDTSNGLVVHWNAGSRPVQDADRAELLIADGGAEPRAIALRADDIRNGTLTYVRQSERVELRLRVRSRSGAMDEAVAHFIGNAPERPATVAAAAPPPPVQPAGAKSAELSRVEQEVTRLNAELRRLQTTAPAPKPVPASGTTERSRLAAAVPPPAVASAAAPSLSGPPQVSIPSTGAPLSVPAAAPVAAPAPPPASAPAAVKASAVERKPASGRAIWTGRLGRGAVLSIDSKRPSMGDLTGRMPSRECRVRVYGGELRDSGLVVYTGSGPERVEPPSAANGWNVTTFRPDGKRSRDVAVLEAPNKANGWQRLMVRSDRPVSVLVIDWEEVGN